MPTCRACGARIIFHRTPDGRTMPLDPHPSEHGNVYLDRPDLAAPPVAVVLGGDELETVRGAGTVPLYVAHFATCPHADRFRRPSRRDLEEAAGVTRLDDHRRARQAPRLPGLDT